MSEIALLVGVGLVLGLYALICSARYEVAYDCGPGWSVTTRTLACAGVEYEVKIERSDS